MLTQCLLRLSIIMFVNLSWERNGGTTTFSLSTLSKTTLSIMYLIVTLHKHKVLLCWMSLCLVSHFQISILNVNMLSVIMQNVLVINVMAPSNDLVLSVRDLWLVIMQNVSGICSDKMDADRRTKIINVLLESC